MDVALYSCALLLASLGLLGSVVPVIPGPALSFVALLIAFLSSTPPVSTAWLGLYLLLSIVVSVMDMFLPAMMTKWMGGSKSGMWGANIGLVVGFIAFPPFGVIWGPLFGAIMGELSRDREDPSKALKVGLGAFLAFFVGSGIKFCLSLWILWILVAEFFPAVWSALHHLLDMLSF
ncbi:MAG: DUF456 domain-containing protein [Rikenellaceae bacterium]